MGVVGGAWQRPSMPPLSTMFARRSFAAPPRRRLLRVSVAVVAALVLGFGVCEVLGWPFLATPMQRWLSSTLERRVSFASHSAIHPSGGSASDPSGEFQGKTQVKIHLLGRIEIAAAQIEIGAPSGDLGLGLVGRPVDTRDVPTADLVLCQLRGRGLSVAAATFAEMLGKSMQAMKPVG